MQVLIGGGFMNHIKKLLNKETLLYLVFGVATTVVNYVVFTLFYNVLFQNENSLTANLIAFIVAVVFAFVVNKRYVFESKSWDKNSLAKEVPSFLAARLGSFAFEEFGLLVCDRGLRLGNVIILETMGQRINGITAAKLILSIAVVIINYVLCKWFVFRKQNR